MILVALRGLVGRKLRALLTGLAIVLGVAMISGAYVLTDSIGRAFDTIFTGAFASSDAYISGKEAFETDFGLPPPFSQELLRTVRSLAVVESAAGRINDRAQLIDKQGESIGGGFGPPALGFGIDANARRFSPLTVKQGGWPRGARQIAIDTATARKQHFAIGDTIRVRAKGPARPFRIVGIVEFGGLDSLGGATIALFDLATAQTLFRKQGQLDAIHVVGRSDVSSKRLLSAIAGVLPSHAQVRTGAGEAEKQSEDVKQGVGILQKVILAFGGVALFVGAFIIFNSLSITVAQRAREFALVRTIGASRRQVLGSVIFEALLVGALASLTGLFLGLGMARLLRGLFASFGFDPPQAGLALSARTALVSLAVGIAVTLAASVVPALRATRVPPVAILREGASLPRSRLAPALPYLAVVMITGGVAALGYGLFAGDVGVSRRLSVLGLGCFALFVGVALLSPRLVRPLAAVLGWPAARLAGASGALARENSTRNQGRTAVTAAALMIGVTLVTFVAVFAQGLRHSVTESIDRQLRVDYIATTESGFTPFDPSAATALAAVPGVRVTNIRGESARGLGEQTTASGLDLATIASSFRFDWIDGSDAVLASLGRSGAIVEEGFAAKHHLRPGSRFTLQSPAGRSVELTVKGIYDSPPFADLLGAVDFATETFDAIFPDPKNLYALVDTPTGRSEPVKQTLEQALSGFPDLTLRTQQEYVDHAAARINQTLGLLFVLLALSVIISLFGIVNTLVLSVFERTREIGMLCAIGMSRWQVRSMIAHESVITALLGATLGLGLGLFLAALVTTALKDEAGLVFSVPLPTLVAFTAVAAVAGLAAAILPARRAARLNILEALEYE